MDSVARARKLDGLPPLKRSKTSLDNLLKAHAETPVPEDDDEELLFVETPTDDEEIFMVKRSTGTVVEPRLTPEEKELFAEAKRQACMVFFENKAWAPVKKAGLDPEKCAPLRFLLRWKYDDNGK